MDPGHFLLFRNSGVWTFKIRKKKQQNIQSPISGQSKRHAYLTKTKTVLKLEDIAHNEHPHIPQKSTEYSQGTSGKNIKNHKEARSY